MNKENRLSTYVIKKSNCNYIYYKYYHAKLLDAFERYAKGKLLDIGCGNKPYNKYLENLVEEHIGCDREQSSMEKVDVICNATEIPFISDEFDTVISTQVLEHLSDPCLMIAEAYRTLKKNGYFILSTNLLWPIHEAPYDFYRFTKYGLIHLLEEYEFEVIECHACGGKWAMVGQFLLLSCLSSFDNKKPYILRLPAKVKNRILLFIANRLFPFLDSKYKNEDFTMNYVIVAKK